MNARIIVVTAAALAIVIGTTAGQADSIYQQECQTSRVNGQLQLVCTSSFDTIKVPPSREDVTVKARPASSIIQQRERQNFCGLHFRMTADGACEAMP